MSQQGNINYLFSTSTCPSDETLKQYAFGLLQGEDKRRVELHLAACEICSDMVEGMQISGSLSSFNDEVELIKTEARSRLKQQEIKVIPIYKQRYFSIAAMLALLIGFGFLIRTFLNDPAPDNIAANQQPVEEKVVNETPLPPAVENTVDAQAQTPQSATATRTIEKPAAANQQIAITEVETREEKTADEKLKSTDANLSSGKAVMESPAEQDLAEDDRQAVNEQKDMIKVTEDITTAGSTSTPSAQAPSSMEVASTRSLSKKESTEKFSVVSQSELTAAQQAFNKADYAQAKALLKKELKSNPNQADVLFLLAKTERMLKNYSNSNNYFFKLIANNNSNFKEESEWQMALNFKDNKQLKEAKEFLTKISKGKGKYAYPAAELLGELDE